MKPHYKWSVVYGRGRWVLANLRWHPAYPIHLSTFEPRYQENWERGPDGRIVSITYKPISDRRVEAVFTSEDPETEDLVNVVVTDDGRLERVSRIVKEALDHVRKSNDH